MLLRRRDGGREGSPLSAGNTRTRGHFCRKPRQVSIRVHPAGTCPGPSIQSRFEHRGGDRSPFPPVKYYFKAAGEAGRGVGSSERAVGGAAALGLVQGAEVPRARRQTK